MRLRDGLSLGSDVVIDSATNITSKDFYVDSSLPTVKPTLNLNFAKTKSLDPRITFTRASTASYFDQNGVLKYAAVNEPRFDHDPITGESLGLLIEETRTNLVSDGSEDFRLNNAEGGRWSASTSGTAIVTNDAIAPDGNLTANKIIATDTAYGHSRYTSTGGTANTTYTASMFVKSAGYNYAYIFLGNSAYAGINTGIFIDLTTGATSSYGSGIPVGYGVIKCQNGWWRIWVSQTSDVDGGNFVLAFGIAYNMTDTSFLGNNIDGIYVWGAQVEAGSYPTSYIPTVATTVTRSADIATIPASTFATIYNPAEGTFNSTAKTAGYDATHGVFYVSSSSNEYIATRFVNTSRLNSVVVAGGVTTVSASSPTSPSLTANEYVNASIAYKVNDFGGVTKDLLTTTTSGNVPVSGNPLQIGHFNNLYQLNGHIKKLVYYPKRLPNETLQELTK